MPDLKNAAEVGSNMNGCLIWGILGFVVFVGMSVGSAYMVFMGLLVGGAMLGGKAMAGNKKNTTKSSSSVNSTKSYSIEQRKALIAGLRSESDNQATYPSGIDANSMKRNVDQSLSNSVSQSTDSQSLTQSSGVDLVAKLEKLAELKKKGYLSDEEYALMKANVISNPTSIDQSTDSQINHLKPDVKNTISEPPRTSNFSADDLI